MKRNSLSVVRNYLLTGTALTALMTAGFLCNDPPPYGSGGQVWNCGCACPDAFQDFEAKVCGNDAYQASGNCVGRCSQSGCFKAYVHGPTGESGCGGIEGQGLWSGPGPKSSEVKLDPENSFADVTLWGEPATVRMGGEASFTGGCETGRCSIDFQHIYLAPGDFSLRGPEGTEIVVKDLTLLNSGVIAGTQVDGVFAIPSEQLSLLVNGNVNGASRSYQLTLDRGQEFSGFYVPSTGKFGITARFLDEGESIELALDIRGRATARPPVADAGRPQEVVADRGSGAARVTLDGSASIDFDDDLAEIQWFEGDRRLGSGARLDVELGVGRHTLTAMAIDATEKIDTADTDVTVTEE